MDNRVTELIEQKSFTELSVEERNFVLSQISEQEYIEKHQLILEIKKDLKSEASQLKVNDSIRLDALIALRAKHAAIGSAETTKSRIGFFTFKIPLWTAVAAVFMIFILTTPLFIDSQFKDNKANDLVASIDTVYIDKVIRDTIAIMKPADTVVKTVYKTIVVSDPIVEASQTTKYPETEDNLTDLKSRSIQRDLERAMAIGDYPNTIDFKTSLKGKSLSNDPIGRVVLGVSN